MVYHYLNKSVPGYYIEYDYLLEEGHGNKPGTTYEDFLDENTWILLSDEQLAFKQNNPTASPKEVIEMQLAIPTPSELLSKAKSKKMQDIRDYFNSSKVKSLKYDENEIWANKDERIKLREKCEAAIRNNNVSIELFGITDIDPNVGIYILDAMFNHEEACEIEYNSKISNVNNCVSVEGVELIDPSASYPSIIETTSAGVKEKLEVQKSEKPENQLLAFSRSVINNFDLTPNQALECKTSYPIWGDVNAYMGKFVDPKYRFQFDGLLYEVLQAHILSPEWEPGFGTESLYKVVQKEHSGDFDDPIPWVKNMEIFKDKYYIENDLKYLCIQDSGIALSYTLEELVQAGYVQLV